MSRYLIAYLTAAMTLLPAVSGPAQDMMPDLPPPLPAGTRAPAFTTRTLSGKTVRLKSLRGKVVLLDYWATWCEPCRMATPVLEALHKKFGRQGLAVVGMSVDDDHSIVYVRPFTEHFGLTYTITASPRANGRAQSAYHGGILPAQFLIDKKGIVRWSQSGFNQGEAQELSSLIKTLLAEK